MRRNLAMLLAAVVTFGAVHYAHDHLSAWLRGEMTPVPGLTAKPWIEQSIPETTVVFSAPWALTAEPLPIPSEQRKLFSTITNLQHEADGLNISIIHFALIQGDASLEGAVAGAVQSIRAQPDIASVTETRRDSRILDLPAVEIELRIQRQSAPPLEMHGVFIADAGRFYQIMIIYIAGGSEGLHAWEKLRASIHRNGPA
jgi:hypothetical protein